MSVPSTARVFLRACLTFVLIGVLLLAVGPRLAIADDAPVNPLARDDAAVLEACARIGVDSGLGFMTAASIAVKFSSLVNRARAGEPADVLPELRNFLHSHPHNSDVLADTFIVLHWAQRDAEALELLPAISKHRAAPYLFPYVINAARRLGQSATALQVHGFMNQQRRGRSDSIPLALELDLLLMLRESGEWLQALAAVEPLLLRYPKSRELLAFKVETAAQGGSYSIALEAVGQTPDVIAPEQAIQIRQDWNTQWIKLGAAMQSASDSPERFAASSIAIANGYQWLDDAQASGSDLDRSRYDQIAALRDRDAMHEVIEIFQSLEGEIPAYVLIATAQAYVRTRQPAKAARLYELALGEQKSPDTWSHRIDYAYALLDSEQPLAALDVIDEVDIEIGEALLANASTRHDPDVRQWRDRIEVARANFERFTQRYDLAELRLQLASSRSPFDPDLRIARAGLLANRDLPRQSLAVLDRVVTDYPDSAPAHLARADALLDMGEIAQARSSITDIESKLGEHPRLERLNEKMRRKTAPWLKLSYDASNSDEYSSFISTPRERKAEAYAESHLINDRVRLIASSNYHRANFPEGRVLRRLQSLGASWEDSTWSIHAMGLSGDQMSPGGYRVKVRHTFSDAWSVLARVSNNSDDSPLRAYAAGISLNTRGAQLQWKLREHRSVSASYDAGAYSDQNQRGIVAMNWRELWLSEPHQSFSTNLSISNVKHSLSETPYFSPANYTSVSLAMTIQKIIGRIFDRSWKHEISVEPAIQAQAGKGRRLGGSLRYQQEMDLSRDIGIRAGLNYLRRTFDGVQEERWFASVDWFMRF